MLNLENEFQIPKLLKITSFNLHNFGEWSTDARKMQFANLIASTLKASDIIGLQEVGGLSNKENQPVQAQVMQTICQILKETHQLDYTYYDIPPLPDQNGGEKGLNIRSGFLVKNTQSIQIQSIELLHQGLTCFAGDSHLKFTPCRHPLAMKALINGLPFLIINCHLKSKRNSKNQPSKNQRQLQAKAVYDFVKQQLENKPKLRVIVLGDLNDSPRSSTLVLLTQALMKSALDSITQGLNYTCRYGTQQLVFDYILYSSDCVIQSVKIHSFEDESVTIPFSDHYPISAEFILK